MKNERKSRSFRCAAAVFAAFAVMTAASACGKEKPAETTAATEAPAEDGSLDRVLKAGKLVIGVDAHYPPMGFTDDSGEIVGFDIDVAQEVCNRLGISLVKQPIAWETNEEALARGEVDCVWNGLSITSERADKMDFTVPYMQNRLIFVVADREKATTTDDLKGRTIGVQKGATAVDVLASSGLYSDISVSVLEDNPALFEFLDSGRLDAVFVDSVVAYYYIATNGSDYYVLPGSLADEDYAVGFRKGDTTLRDKVQDVMREMKADGTLSRISTEWFGSDITTLK